MWADVNEGANQTGRVSSSPPAVAILMRNELLGDAITHVPAYRALRIAYPHHRIVALYKEQTAWAGALSAVRADFIDDIRTDLAIGDGVAATYRVLKEVENLDLVLDFRANLHTLWTLFAISRLSARYVANVSGFALRRGVPGGIVSRPETNAARYHRMVELAAGRALPFDGRLAIPGDARAQAQRLIQHGQRYLCLAVGSPQSTKAWPRDKWIGLANHVANLGLLPVFLIGVQEDGEREWIARDVPQAMIVDRVSAERPEQLPWLFAALGERAVGAVTVEGGIGHLLATAALPLLTIAGPTNPRRWRPVTPYHWIVWSQEFGSSKTADVPLEVVMARTQELVDFSERRAAEQPDRVSPADQVSEPPTAQLIKMKSSA